MIVVTAPTSRIGRQLLRTILQADEPVRVIARDPSRLPPETHGRVEVVQGSHRDRDVVDRAFAGADAVFWLVPADRGAPSVDAAYVEFSRPACAAFRTHGVARVVGISALGRGTPSAGQAGLVSASLRMDDLIAASGVGYRALTCASFMDNLLRQVEPIRTAGSFSWPIAGDRRVPLCATRDIAAVAARLLSDRSWSGQASIPLLGPEDLSHDDMARIMSEVLGWPVRFQQVAAESLRPQLTAAGYSEAMTHAMIDMLVAKDRGLDDGETRGPEPIAPTGFRQWCAEVLRPAVLGRPGPDTPANLETPQEDRP